MLFEKIENIKCLNADTESRLRELDEKDETGIVFHRIQSL
jgi:hypothetical protein